MVAVTQPTPHGRGCGTRKSNSLYLCCGTDPDGSLSVEDLVIDPVRVWEHGWQRGFSIYEINGINHVIIFVGKNFYPAPWDFIEEAREYGVSRNVRNTFPIEKLTPHKSLLFFAHAHAWPKFEYEANMHHTDHCRIHRNTTADEVKKWGYHTPPSNPERLDMVGAKNEPCAFTLQDLAVLQHPGPIDESVGRVKIEMPSFEYYAQPPLSINGEQFNSENPPAGLEWEIGIFWRCPFTHVEAKGYLDTDKVEKVQSTGYEVAILDY